MAGEVFYVDDVFLHLFTYIFIIGGAIQYSMHKEVRDRTVVLPVICSVGQTQLLRLSCWGLYLLTQLTSSLGCLFETGLRVFQADKKTWNIAKDDVTLVKIYLHLVPGTVIASHNL